jgi:predicted chitinase
MIESTLKSAVGIGSRKLVATQDTFLKRSPVQSTDLVNTEKLAVTKGFEIVVTACSVENSHYAFESDDARFAGKGYAFMGHFVAVGGIDAAVVLVSQEQFYAIAPQTSLDKLEPLVAPLNIALAKYEINTPLRICHFLAQCCHESDQFNTTEEYASGDDYDDRTDLGNTPEIDGDGRLYKGRSLIQITGKESYGKLGDYLGVDLISNPELLANPEYAWLGAGWFWATRRLNELADQDNFRRITIVINGGTNGWDCRLDALARAKQAFGI